MIIINLLILYETILIVRIILSWIKVDHNQPFMQFIYKITEPVLKPIRRLLPIESLGFDFSPIIVFIIIEFLKSFFRRGFYTGY